MRKKAKFKVGQVVKLLPRFGDSFYDKIRRRYHPIYYMEISRGPWSVELISPLTKKEREG